MLENYRTVRTTLTIPADLNRRTQHFVDAGLIPSRNALIVAALEKYLLELEHDEIDRQFAAMAGDESYGSLSEQISESFAESDWEALVDGGQV